MTENAIYFAKESFYQIIRAVGGSWNSINKYITLPEDNIASCYYHVGRTTTKSIFLLVTLFQYQINT